MRTYVAFPSTAIDIAARSALDEGIGAGGEVFGLEDIVHATGSTSGIDVFLHRAAEQGDIGSTIDVAAKRIFLLTVSSTVGIVCHVGTFVDNDVGVVFLTGQLGGHLGIRLRLQLKPVADTAEVGGRVVNVVSIRIITVYVFCRSIVVAKGPGISPVMCPVISIIGYPYTV